MKTVAAFIAVGSSLNGVLAYNLAGYSVPGALLVFALVTLVIYAGSEILR